MAQKMSNRFKNLIFYGKWVNINIFGENVQLSTLISFFSYA